MPTWTSSEQECDHRQSSISRRYLLQETRAGQSSRVLLSDEGLSLAHPLSLMDTGALALTGNLSVSCLEIALPDALAYARREGVSFAVSGETSRHGRLGHLSATWMTEQPNTEFDDYLSTPVGTFFFFDEDWNLRISTAKHDLEDKWEVIRLDKQE